MNYVYRGIQSDYIKVMLAKDIHQCAHYIDTHTPSAIRYMYA